VLRKEEEWVLLPKGTAPAIIDCETMQVIRERLKYHKQDSLRNNNRPKELELLRAGYIYCGICGSRMTVHYPSGQASIKNGITPVYRCQKRAKGDLGIVHNHRTQIHVPLIDRLAWEKVVEALQDHELVRTKVALLREMNAPIVNRAEIEEAIEKTRLAMKNLYSLAEKANDDETIMHLTQRMNELEKQKRETEALLYDVDDKEGELKETEEELVKFEQWAEKVRPQLTDPAYQASYEEKRLALRILGIKVTILPTKGDFPYRYKIEVTI
jgi:site-specific DNA recombinase